MDLLTVFAALCGVFAGMAFFPAISRIRMAVVRWRWRRTEFTEEEYTVLKAGSPGDYHEGQTITVRRKK